MSYVSLSLSLSPPWFIEVQNCFEDIAIGCICACITTCCFIKLICCIVWKVACLILDPLTPEEQFAFSERANFTVQEGVVFLTAIDIIGHVRCLRNLRWVYWKRHEFLKQPPTTNSCSSFWQQQQNCAAVWWAVKRVGKILVQFVHKAHERFGSIQVQKVPGTLWN